MFSRSPSCFDNWDSKDKDKYLVVRFSIRAPHFFISGTWDKYLMLRFSKSPSCFDTWDLRDVKDK
jgi:hypothetical protein